MMKLTIQTDNAAFADGLAGVETGRILHKLATKAEHLCNEDLAPLDGLALVDTNGNRVGTVTIDPPPTDSSEAIITELRTVARLIHCDIASDPLAVQFFAAPTLERLKRAAQA